MHKRYRSKAAHTEDWKGLDLAKAPASLIAALVFKIFAGKKR